MDMITQGAIAAATVIWLLSYLGFRKVFNFAFITDALITGTLVFMFSGSYAGMMTGVIAGLMVSMFIRGGRATVGTSKPRWVRRSGNIMPSLVWVRSKRS